MDALRSNLLQSLLEVRQQSSRRREHGQGQHFNGAVTRQGIGRYSSCGGERPWDAKDEGLEQWQWQWQWQWELSRIRPAAEYTQQVQPKPSNGRESEDRGPRDPQLGPVQQRHHDPDECD